MSLVTKRYFIVEINILEFMPFEDIRDGHVFMLLFIVALQKSMKA
jgi:hypothetical protein